jgi:hypothetical protein
MECYRAIGHDERRKVRTRMQLGANGRFRPAATARRTSAKSAVTDAMHIFTRNLAN